MSIIQKQILYNSGNKSLEFLKVKDLPGYSHRVVINGLSVDWLSVDTNPTRKAAQYYLAKHKDTTQIRLPVVKCSDCGERIIGDILCMDCDSRRN